MTKYDLIGQLKRYALANNMVFLSGAKFNQNYEADQAEYKNGQLILSADFLVYPTIVNGVSNPIKYTGAIALGIKFDDSNTIVKPDFADGQPANLDETFIQKYDARLLDLMILLASHIGSFSCDNELEIENITMVPELNKFDTNIDFVSAQLTFIQ
jgi:hypothetical protein